MLPLLLLAWGIHFIYPVIYTAHTQKVKAEQRLKIKRRQGTPVSITLSAPDFEKAYIPDEQELNINGHMYDVVSVRRCGNMVCCTALPDKKETTLHTQLAHRLTNDKTGKTAKQSVYWWPVVYNSSGDIVIHSCAPGIDVPQTRNYFFKVSEFKNEITEPPEQA